MTIHLPQNLESSILAAIHRGRYASVDEAMAEAASLLVQRLEQEQARPEQPIVAGQPSVGGYKPIWDIAAELRATVPPEEWTKAPADGAAQHDHYIYGTPKRPVS
jgi:Arc/MetJ-type ribon-helix-helix transcriptional regulator